jgi:hypothetical protein
MDTKQTMESNEDFFNKLFEPRPSMIFGVLFSACSIPLIVLVLYSGKVI